jgi:BirA family biotin operon repressor/biotin-[acetyl-CoA-carboxylase] ligase
VTAIAGWPKGLPLVRHETLDSTNEEARRMAEQGVSGPLWIVARSQTAGRGRRGNSWISEPGNLFATLLLQEPSKTAAELGFAASLAAGETVAAYVDKERVRLKWPNDLLLDGRKVGGILLETLKGNALATGIGIDLAHHPLKTEFPAISLCAVLGHAPDPEEVLAKLAGRLAAWYEIWRGRGFPVLRATWLERAAGLGGEIRARLPGKEICGVFENLDQDGALLLRKPDRELTRITAGEVFFRTP